MHSREQAVEFSNGFETLNTEERAVLVFDIENLDPSDPALVATLDDWVRENGMPNKYVSYLIGVKYLVMGPKIIFFGAQTRHSDMFSAVRKIPTLGGGELNCAGKMDIDFSGKDERRRTINAEALSLAPQPLHPAKSRRYFIDVLYPKLGNSYEIIDD